MNPNSGSQIRDLLYQVERTVAAREGQFIRENHAMGRSDFCLLDNLCSHEPLPVSDLGRKLLLTSGSITSAIDRVEKKGLVRRRRSPVDRRLALVELTPNGRELVEATAVRHAEMLEELFSSLTEVEKSQLANILQKLAK
jgi:MarR family 2-MHQ and catechol resistance regulon transcriptional repressor